MPDFTKVIEWLKLSIQQLFWLLLFSSVVLSLLVFTPDNVLGALGLRGFRTEYRMWVGLSAVGFWILSFSGLVVIGGQSISQWGKRAIGRRGRKRRLHSLTQEERGVLRGYIAEDKRTQYFDISDGVVQGLFLEGILFKPSNISSYITMAYNIQPWVWDYLNKHPDLVKETAPP